MSRAGRARPDDAGCTTAAAFAAWDPFTDACDAAQGRATEYLEAEQATAARAAAAPPEDWDPFEDPEMLEVTGELAMQSDDLEAIEAWIEQAQAARLPWEKIGPKRDRVVDLRCRKKDEASRKVLKDKLQEALKGDDRGRLRETIAAAAKAGVAHPRTLDAATRQLEEMRQAEAEFFRKKNAEEAARWEANADDLASAAIEKVRKAQLVPSVDIELTSQERAALERQARRERGKLVKAEQLDAEVSIRLVFPSGFTEAIKARPTDMGAMLLVALLPFRDEGIIPPEFGLFLPGGELLDFTRPLLEQGLQAGGDVRVDDAWLGGASEQQEGHEELLPGPPACSSFWRFDPENGLPMAIRSGPGAADGLQTDLVLQPGELLEVSEEQEGPEGVLYLKLADGRGWVVDRKPAGGRKCVRHDAGRSRTEEELAFELEHRWLRVYWPLTNSKPRFSVVRDALKKTDQVVVLGWNATGDAEVMKMALEVCRQVRGDALLATGEPAPLVGLPGPPTTSLHLQLSAHAESQELALSIFDEIRKLGVTRAYAVVVVSTSFHSRRLVSALGRYGCPEMPSATIIPYSQDPQAMCWVDCRTRKLDILAEAQLLAALDPQVFDAAAEAAMEQLLRDYPTGRPTCFPLTRRPSAARGGPTQQSQARREEQKEALQQPKQRQQGLQGPTQQPEQRQQRQREEQRAPQPSAPEREQPLQAAAKKQQPQRQEEPSSWQSRTLPQPQPQQQPQQRPEQARQQEPQPQQQQQPLRSRHGGGAAAQAPGGGRQEQSLPRGWERHVDPESGWPYYYHAAWNCWQWDVPTEGSHHDDGGPPPPPPAEPEGAAPAASSSSEGRSIEFADTDGNAVCFRLAESGVEYLVNGELRACSLTQVSVWGGRRINVVGASPSGRGPHVRTSATVPAGSEGLALAVQEMSRGR